MSWWAWVAIAAAMLAAAALVLGIFLYRRQQEVRVRLGLDGRSQQAAGDAHEDVDEAEQPGQLVAFVANPSKPDVEMLRKEILAAVADGRMPEMLWLETSVEDPGVGQARQAVAAGADLVVAIGGDGTVRAVAEALVGTGVPMGLLPLGTGNLLARNLDLPIGNPLGALEVALTGIDRTIDVGWVRILDGGQGPATGSAGIPVAESDPTRWPTDADAADDAGDPGGGGPREHV
ncbi:MAG TPA: diacylglycerol kinase family protein, partial [Cellulomonas sp.]|nr:diacylglycerol kinase family protein [Cellulomonas sp.]